MSTGRDDTGRDETGRDDTEIARIFDEASELEGDERARYLERHCSEAQKRAEVDALLARFEEGLELGADAPLFEMATPLPLPERIGAYRIERELGSGGMGVVYLAHQSEPVERAVALKVTHASLRGSEAMVRFEAERRALARLAHPNVAQLYDAGSTDDGFPYFAMELVEGAALLEHCDRAQLSVEERLGLFLDVCAGVQHAHQKGVLHRDLKPSNLLIAVQGERPVPKVIDFGIAKAIDERPGDSAELTGARPIGTPAYMSPEALAGSTDLDTRTDVFSLGMVLYELVAGVRPDPPMGSSVLRVHTTPPTRNAKRPSTMLSALDGPTAEQVSTDRGSTPALLAKRIRGDLDWIVLRAIDDDPERRYASVALLAADVKRHLDDLPVEACPPRAREVLRKFVRRHRVAVGAAALVLVTLVAGVIGTSLSMLRALRAEAHALDEADRADREARHARQAEADAREAEAVARTAEADAQAAAERAELEAAAARNTSDFLVDLFRLAVPGAGGFENATVRQLVEAGAARVRTIEGEPLLRARLMNTIGSVYERLGLYAEALPFAEEAAAIVRDDPGSSAEERAHTILNLGFLQARFGQLERARTNYEEAIAIQLEANLDRTPLFGSSLMRVAWLDNIEGRLDEAERGFRRSLEVIESLPNPHPIDVAQALTGIGALVAERDPGEGLEYFMRALDVRVAEVGDDHPDIIANLINVALNLIELDRDDDARDFLERAIGLIERHYGSAHPDLAVALIAVGETIANVDDAAAYYERGVAIQEAALPGSPTLAESLMTIGQRYAREGDLDRAAGSMVRAVRIFDTVLGSENPLAQAARAQLAEVEAALREEG